jgi:hypothetical protein
MHPILIIYLSITIFLLIFFWLGNRIEGGFASEIVTTNMLIFLAVCFPALLIAMYYLGCQNDQDI